MAIRPMKGGGKGKGKSTAITPIRKAPFTPTRQVTLKQQQRPIPAYKPGKGAGKASGGKGGNRFEKQLAEVQREAFLAGKAAAMKKGSSKGGNRFAGKNSRPGSKPVSAIPRYQAVQQAKLERTRGKGKGKGKGREKGKGKGKSRKPEKKFDESVLCWVGGLSPTTSFKALEKHFAEVVKPKHVVLMNRNPSKPASAKIAFASAEDVACVIDALNGSELNGKKLEVDTWTNLDPSEKKERIKERRSEAKAGKAKLSKVLNTKFAKAAKAKVTKAKSKAEIKVSEILKKTDASCKVWIGGLAAKTTWKSLEKHFAETVKPKATEIMKNGKAVLAYENADDVSTVISALNGSELDGKTIEVDVWVKPAREDRKGKDKPKKED